MKRAGTYKTTRIDAFNRELRTGMYDDVADTLNGSNMYDSVIIPIPQKMDERVATNRINTALSRYFIELPDGTYLMKRVCWYDSERVIQVIVMPSV